MIELLLVSTVLIRVFFPQIGTFLMCNKYLTNYISLFSLFSFNTFWFNL